ncbi:MAG: carbamoyltransferase HypF [Methylomonas sp.]|jgi:hydrogenase maturation protein HypF
MPGKAIRIRGVVQGVGFRPAIWRLATQHRLSGEVWNDGQGVMIHAYGGDIELEAFIRDIPQHLPPLARLDGMEAQTLHQIPASGEFRIIDSRHSGMNTLIAADAATCPDCLREISDPGDRRYRYPFTNCTHCGPRLSIVGLAPYDRRNTSMAEFGMCPDCQAEYDNPADRRFHAQANCCPDCGPNLWLEDEQGRAPAGDPLGLAADFIRQGRIVAIKGVGGFHLACNAGDAAAVSRLRERKRRYAKPFALMGRDIDMITRYARLNETEALTLQDKAAPIVLLNARGETLAPDVAPGDDKLGFMLPYTPLHTLLLRDLDFPIVLTSGNISDEPQCIDNGDARARLAGIADYLLLHDRAIVNRLDDSVTRLMGGQIRLLRRARGYCPETLLLPAGFGSAGNILAMGAELKNSFCLLKNGQAIVAQHCGDLENAGAQRDYRATISLYKQLYNFRPARIAVDNHPGYLSTQYGQMLAEADTAVLTPVQHHHAHLAACLAEHGAGLDAPPVLAAIFDGLGMGGDGELWGGEFLLGDYKSYTRLGCFQPIALPGGNQAMKEPWRNAYAQLAYYFDWPALQREYAHLDIIKSLSAKPLATLSAMIEKNINSPACSSCGRWFDAFAAALGLHGDRVDYEGQAAIALEMLAAPAFANVAPYPQAWSIPLKQELLALNWRGLWQAVLTDLSRGADKARIAARIHHSLIAATVETLNRLSLQTGARVMVLSGGVFQNRLLLESVTRELEECGKTVLAPQRYPMNDGGLALGQAVIAAVSDPHIK